MSKTSIRQLNQPFHPLQVHHHRHKTHKSSWCCIESFYMLLTQRNAVEGTFWTKKLGRQGFHDNTINKITSETNQTSEMLIEESIIGKATKHTVVMSLLGQRVFCLEPTLGTQPIRYSTNKTSTRQVKQPNQPCKKPLQPKNTPLIHYLMERSLDAINKITCETNQTSKKIVWGICYWHGF